MGRSRGGNTTKIHAIVDRNGLPIALKLTAGQAHDGKAFETMMGGLVKARFCSLIAPTTVTPSAPSWPNKARSPTSARSVFVKIHPP